MAQIMKLGPLADQIDLNDWTKHAVSAGGFSHQLDYRHETVSMPLLKRSRPLPTGVSERVITLNLWVRGSTKANLMVNWRNILAQLELARRYIQLGEGSPVYLEYRPDGATDSVFFDVLDGYLPPFPDGGQIHGEWIQNAQLTLYCNPYGRGNTVYADPSGTLTWGSACPTTQVIPSDCDTPAYLSIKNKTVGAEYDYMMVATRSRGNVDNFIEEYIAGVDTMTYGIAAALSAFLPLSSAEAPVSSYGVFTLTIRAWVPTGGTSARIQAVYRKPSSGTGATYDVGQQILVTSTTPTDFTVKMPFNPSTHLRWNDAAFTGTFMSNVGHFGVRKIGNVEVRIGKMTVTYTTIDRDLAEASTVVSPNAAGTSGDWAATGGAAYAVLADSTDTTYISSATDGQVTTVKFPVPGGYLPANRGIRFVAYPSILNNWDLEDTPNPYSSDNPSGVNMISSISLIDPGFEVDLQADGVTLKDWTSEGFNAGDVEVVSSGAHGGSKALGIRGYGYAGIMRAAFNLPIGGRYRFSIWAKVDNATSGIKGSVGLIDGLTPVAQSNNSELPRETFVQSTTWTEVTYDFTCNSGRIYVELKAAYGSSTMVDEALFDDISFMTLGRIPDGWLLNGTVGTQQASAIAHGSSAVSLNPGSPSSGYLYQTVAVVDGATYRLRAAVKDGARVRLESGANIVELRQAGLTQNELQDYLNGDLSQAEVDAIADNAEKFIVADGTSMTVKLYAEDLPGTIDAVRLVRVDRTMLGGFTITSGLSDQYGRFRLLGRMRATNGPLRVRSSYGGPDDYETVYIANEYVDVEDSPQVKLVDLGLIQIPATTIPDGVSLASFAWRLSIDYSAIDVMDDYAYLDMDSFRLVPLDENYWEVEQLPGSGPLTDEYVISDPLGSAAPAEYIATSAGYMTYPVSHVGSYLRLPPKKSKLLVIVARSRNDHRRADSFEVLVRRNALFEAFYQ